MAARGTFLPSTEQMSALRGGRYVPYPYEAMTRYKAEYILPEIRAAQLEAERRETERRDYENRMRNQRIGNIISAGNVAIEAAPQIYKAYRYFRPAEIRQAAIPENIPQQLAGPYAAGADVTGRAVRDVGDLTGAADYTSTSSVGYTPIIKDIGGAAGYAVRGAAGMGAGYLAKRTGLSEGIRDVAGFGGKREWDIATNAAIGFLTGGPAGLAVSLAGSALGEFTRKNCIIITACTSPDSYEVKIAREFRDKKMTEEQVRGYYIFAELLVPVIEKSDELKEYTKKYLVDRLVDFGEWALGKKQNKPSQISCIVTLSFLNMCKDIGIQRTSYVRNNGEVV